MSDLLLELLSEEIPARMQAKASADLARLFEEQLTAAGLKAERIETYATPRRLALIARGLPAETEAVSEEIKGPRASAPPQALEGFLRKTGLTRDQLVERDGILFAVIDKPGRQTAEVLAEAIPAIVRAFPWPKSMRWGAASASTESLRWVRPLQGIVALLGDAVVQFEIAGIKSGAATVGHRFHHPGAITIGSANDYAEKLRACHVIIDPAERRRIIAEGASRLAAQAGLTLVEDEGLLHENAGLTEWPVPLLGAFDPAYLEVPREVIQLTMRTNQKYFALLKSSPERGGGPPPQAVVEGAPHAHSGSQGPLHHAAHGPPPRAGEDQLAPNFICVANIEASDSGQAIVAGNEKVLAARLSDAKFFWDHDLKIPLEEQAKKLDQIVFHEKLGTVADKVERVAKLARWLVEEGIVKSSPERGGGPPPQAVVEGAPHAHSGSQGPLHQPSAGPPPRSGEDLDLATQAETAARLAKADLVTGMVGEFPELQGLIGGYLARAQGHPAPIADAIRDHYKPVGQADEVPTVPVTVAVSLADKLDTLIGFFSVFEKPTGSKDPFALRRAALGIIQIIVANSLRLSLGNINAKARSVLAEDRGWTEADEEKRRVDFTGNAIWNLVLFFTDRLEDSQRRSGIRLDLIRAVTPNESHIIDVESLLLGTRRRKQGQGVTRWRTPSWSISDDPVAILARVKALQAFVETREGADLLAGYKRAANILKKEGWPSSPLVGDGRVGGAAASAAEKNPSASEVDKSRSAADAAGPHPNPPHEGEGENSLSYTPENEEAALIAALDAAEPRARAAVEAEDFEGAMAALASLRAPVDAFFDKVTVNDPDQIKRTARLDLLARMRAAVHEVADFSKIEG